MLCIIRLGKCVDGRDITILPYTPYRLIHFWEIDDCAAREWFHSLYRMKGGLADIMGKWNVTINQEDLDNMNIQNVCGNRILDNTWVDARVISTYVFMSYIPNAPHF